MRCTLSGRASPVLVVDRISTLLSTPPSGVTARSRGLGDYTRRGGGLTCSDHPIAPTPGKGRGRGGRRCTTPTFALGPECAEPRAAKANGVGEGSTQGSAPGGGESSKNTSLNEAQTKTRCFSTPPPFTKLALATYFSEPSWHRDGCIRGAKVIIISLSHDHS